LRLDERTAEAVRRLFSRMVADVRLYYFASSEDTPYQRATREVLRALSELSDKLHLVEADEASPLASRYGVDKFPAILVHGVEEYNIRYFGAPLGHEFGVLVRTIVDASRGEVELPPDVVSAISKVGERVHVQVFVTPTCPYCSLAARAAFMYAIVNLNVVADVIEAAEFPELADRYAVYAVPKVVINDQVEFEGAVPHEVFVERILEAVS